MTDNCENCGGPTKERRRRFCGKGCATAWRNKQAAKGRDHLARMMERVEEHADGCWVYAGYQMRAGYGSFWLNGRTYNAQRAMWIIVHGEEPPRHIQVCHTCDNRMCVNPGHLFLGTAADNMNDKVVKGRHRRGTPNPRRGEDAPGAKLTNERVLEIRARYVPHRVSQYQLAKEYGVSQPTIGKIVRGEYWRHI